MHWKKQGYSFKEKEKKKKTSTAKGTWEQMCTLA